MTYESPDERRGRQEDLAALCGVVLAALAFAFVFMLVNLG